MAWPEAGLEICSSFFWANRLFFSKKWANERFTKKNERLAYFWWATWANSSWTLILVSDLSESLMVAHFWWAAWAIRSHHSLKKREWAITCFFKHTKNVPKNLILDFLEFCSFNMSDLSESLTVAHFSWVTWAIGSQLLLCPERSERIAHSCSFDFSNLSKWANKRWANERIPSPGLRAGKWMSREAWE